MAFIRFKTFLRIANGVIIKKTQIYKPKLSAKQTKTAVLDFIARIQRRYTIAQHQPQIIVAHSNASGNSDVATFPLAEKRRILQARRNAFISRRAEYFDTKFEGMGSF